MATGTIHRLGTRIFVKSIPLAGIEITGTGDHGTYVGIIQNAVPSGCTIISVGWDSGWYSDILVSSRRREILLMSETSQTIPSNSTRKISVFYCEAADL
jgi:hypothetical protein